MGTSARRFLLSVLCALVLVLALVNGVAARRRAAEEDEFEGGAGGGDATTASDLDDDLIGEDELLDDSFGDDDLATFAQDDEVDGVAGATSLDHDGGDTTPDVEDGGAVPVGGKKVDPEEPYVGTTSPLMFAGQFTLEYLAMGFIVLFGIVFVMGRMENENIAAAFERQFTEFVSAQFAQVVGADPGRPLLSKESQNAFKMFATGRRGCRGMMVELDLVPRQNLIERVMGMFTKGSGDMVTITIPKTKMEPFVLTVVSKPSKKAVMEAVPNLVTYARPRPTPKRLPSSLELLTDCPEIVPTILPERVCAVIRDSESLFRVMHIADEAALADASIHLASCELRFQFALPSDMSKLAPLLEMAVYMIDVVTAASLSSDAKRVSKRQRKLRESLKKKASREELMAERNRLLEERRAKEQAEYERMTPAQRAKVDAKREAKLLRKRGRPRMKMKM